MAAKTYKVKKVTTMQSPPGNVIRLAEEPPPTPPVADLIITDPTDGECLMALTAPPPSGTVTLDIDAAGNRTMSRP